MTLQIFSQTAITCKDPIATEKFYTKHFGFKRANLIAGLYNYELGLSKPF